MDPQRKTLLQEHPPATVDKAEIQSGLILLDSALQPVAADCGAVTILRSHDASNSGASRQHLPAIPEEIMSIFRSDYPDVRPPGHTVSLTIGKHRYRCRLYIVHTEAAALDPAFIALHLEADSNNTDIVPRIAAEYHLTHREEQALRGMALGLGTKDLANQMNISPNTVKSFIRLIMIKLGVSSRAEIMVKLLEMSDRR